MNFDNAIADTLYAFSDLVGNCRVGDKTPENEELWLVTFQETSVNGKEVVLEVILRDGGIVMSVLDWKHMTKTEARNIANTFMKHLRLV
jgi:hypothetical protein